MSPRLPPFNDHFAVLAQHYDVILSDVWGVVHNGLASAPDACDALSRFRQRNGTVVLITNAPRPGHIVANTTLASLGVPSAAYDGIISSGDVTHALIAARAGLRVFHIGPQRDLGCINCGARWIAGFSYRATARSWLVRWT
jgi:ribonucleotide monophosphatase NagD (HAD superfamily)